MAAPFCSSAGIMLLSCCVYNQLVSAATLRTYNHDWRILGLLPGFDEKQYAEALRGAAASGS